MTSDAPGPGIRPPPPGARPAVEGEDMVQPFQIEASSLRGRIARLGPLLDDILSRHPYPEPVAQLLAETIVMAVLLASGLKFDGVFTLQARGNRVVTMLVVDVTSQGQVRGYASVATDQLPVPYHSDRPASVPDVLGHGHLAFTVDQGPYTDRYQGIVALEGQTLAECVQHYFRQSEQVDTGLTLEVALQADQAGFRGWRAAGLMIQRMPGEGGQAPARSSDHEDDWRRAMVLMQSARKDELLDPGIDPNTLLFRLFHEDGVRVFERRDLTLYCKCSESRVGDALRGIPRAELDDLKIDGKVEVTCEFCNHTFRFGDADLDRLLVKA